MSLEFILGSPLVTADSGTAFSVSAVAQEDGTVFLPRGILNVFMDNGASDAPIDLTAYCGITAIEIDSGSPQAKGLNRSIPAAAFSGKRLADFADLPVVRVKSGTTITLTLEYTATGVEGLAGVEFPFLADRNVGYRNALMPNGPELWAGCPKANVADATDTTFTLTFQDNGVFDFSRVIVRGHLDIAAGRAAPGTHTDSMLIQSAKLNGNQDFVVGQGTRYGSLAFANPLRGRNFYNLGKWAVSSGDTLVMIVRHEFGSEVKDFSFAVPMVASDIGRPPSQGSLSLPCK